MSQSRILPLGSQRVELETSEANVVIFRSSRSLRLCGLDLMRFSKPRSRKGHNVYIVKEFFPTDDHSTRKYFNQYRING